jgi:hypothetical protein
LGNALFIRDTSTPDLVCDGLDEAELLPFVIFGQNVALFC